MVVVLAIDGCESLTVLVSILLFVATSRESRAFLSWNPFQPWALLRTFHSEPIVDVLKWKGNKRTSNTDGASSQQGMQAHPFSLYHSIETQIQWTLITSTRDIITHLPGSSVSKPRVSFDRVRRLAKHRSETGLFRFSVIGKLINPACSRGVEITSLLKTLSIALETKYRTVWGYTGGSKRFRLECWV